MSWSKIEKDKMKSKNERDGAVLGISWGKATARLNNMILFRLVQETNRDVCFRCGNKIDDPTELSRDHIVDWRDHGPDKYWDLDNITFSHKECNRRSGCCRGGRSKRTK